MFSQVSCFCCLCAIQFADCCLSPLPHSLSFCLCTAWLGSFYCAASSQRGLIAESRRLTDCFLGKHPAQRLSNGRGLRKVSSQRTGNTQLDSMEVEAKCWAFLKGVMPVKITDVLVLGAEEWRENRRLKQKKKVGRGLKFKQGTFERAGKEIAPQSNPSFVGIQRGNYLI